MEKEGIELSFTDEYKSILVNGEKTPATYVPNPYTFSSGDDFEIENDKAEESSYDDSSSSNNDDESDYISVIDNFDEENNKMTLSEIFRGSLNYDTNPFTMAQSQDEEIASIGDDSLEIPAILPISDYHGEKIDLPSDLESLASREEPKDGEVKKSEGHRSIIAAGVESIKYLYSLALAVFSVLVVMTAIFTGQSASAEKNIPPIAAFFIFWFLIVWLAVMEGGQGCLVGLQPIDNTKYESTHRRTLKCTRLAYKGDNLERFIVGRQFLVVLVVFSTNMMGSALPGADVLNLSDGVKMVFLDSGVAMILTTIVLGQLTAQVNAASSMLDFINTYFMLFTTYVALGIEFSGFLHSVYLVQIIFSKITGKPIESKEPPRNIAKKIFFWVRVLMSLTILGFAFAVTLKALFDGNTTMWKGAPSTLSVIIFFVLMCFVGMMEGMQIALFAVINMPEEEIANAKVAKRNCDRTLIRKNLQAFLIGRQICVTVCTFVVARITTLNYGPEDDNIFGVSNGVQAFFNTGLLGAVITTIVASLAWRIIATSFPLAFLSNPLIYLIIRLCLLLEKSGICSSAWVFAIYQKSIFGYKSDEVYLHGADPKASSVTRRSKDIKRVISILKYTCSLALVIFSIVMLMSAIFTSQTTSTLENLPPVAAFFIFWFLIVWFARLEGYQGCLVGLQQIDKSKYQTSHKRAIKCTSLVYRGKNMERFIVGRQFLIVLFVYIANMLFSVFPGTEIFDLPPIVNTIFLQTGLSMIAIIIILGQLTSQVNAARSMLDFVDNYLALFTIYLALGIEFSGLLHAVYPFQLLFARITGASLESKESPSLLRKIFFWIRVLISFAVLIFAFLVTIIAMLKEKTVIWNVPPSVTITIFFILIIVLGIMEGVQIAILSLLSIPEEEIMRSKVAHANYKLIYPRQNLQAFLIGRQICVTTCLFVLAKMTSMNVGPEDSNIFNVSDGVQKFFNTGLLGALVTTIVASLAWRVIASSFPLAFLSNPLVYLIIKLCLLLEKTGICSASWVFARYVRVLLRFQPDEVYLEGADRSSFVPQNKRDKNIDITITVLKYAASLALLIFSICIVMAVMFQGQTYISNNTHPSVAFILFWLLLIWLGLMEGGQGAMVGLQLVDKSLYQNSHPKSYKCTCITNVRSKMEKFIVGRQFLVVLVVFVINMSGSPVPGASAFNLPDSILSIFLDSGLAMILCTIIIGQLTAQVNAANCMLDFINTYFMVFTIYVALGIEFSGLLHSVYLVKMLFSRIAGSKEESDKSRMKICRGIFFWVRVLISLVILGLAFAVTLKALFDGNTSMWSGVPPSVSVVIFFILMFFAGLMEGMQIALFAVVNMPEDELQGYRIAHANCKQVFKGKNLQSFLIGRQICVTACMFVIARITTLNVTSDDGNIYNLPDGMQNFFNTGLLGAVITTIVASLAWRIVASSFPLLFLSNPLIFLIIRLCLLLELSGICSSAWLFALIQKDVGGFQPDEVHLRKEKERRIAELV